MGFLIIYFLFAIFGYLFTVFPISTIVLNTFDALIKLLLVVAVAVAVVAVAVAVAAAAAVEAVVVVVVVVKDGQYLNTFVFKYVFKCSILLLLAVFRYKVFKFFMYKLLNTCLEILTILRVLLRTEYFFVFTALLKLRHGPKCLH